MDTELIIDMDMLTDSIYKDNTFTGKKFNEFCDELDCFEYIINPEIYLIEAHVQQQSFFNKIGEWLDNTNSTTKEVFRAYDDITTSGGTLIRSISKLFFGALHFAVKILNFVLMAIAKIPEVIDKIIRSISEIPENIRNKIRGNIRLYISAKDISYFTDKIFPQIDKFIKKYNNKNLSYATISDYYSFKGNVEFRPSTIEVKNQEVINTYFTSTFLSITIGGKKYNYYQALKIIMESLNKYKEDFESLKKNFESTLSNPNTQNELEKMSAEQQAKIRNGVVVQTKMIGLLGNLIRYAAMDLKNIKRITEKIYQKNNTQDQKK
jgi:uncharacterized protein YoxC